VADLRRPILCDEEVPLNSHLQAKMPSSILITGVTGFVGRSLLRFLSVAVPRLMPNVQVFGTSSTTNGHIELETDYPFLKCIKADMLSDLSGLPECDLIFHFASPASAALIESNPLEIFEVLNVGSQNLVKFLRRGHISPRLVLASSGAVYNWSKRNQRVTEDDQSAPLTTSLASCYGEGKRVAEMLLAIGAAQGHFSLTIARMFAFGGLDLPLQTHYALGNFVHDAAMGGPIRIRGNPQTTRSYLAASDMAEWLFSIGVGGRPNATYHVGSEDEITIFELATLVAGIAQDMFGKKVAIETAEDSHKQMSSYYVPSTRKTREELGLSQTVSLHDLVSSMLAHAPINAAHRYGT
jgi:nucleoside-diphosphate-sugar epimerase